MLPCVTAIDCGDGFTCDHDQMCGCSGSSGTARPSSPSYPDGGIAPPPEPVPQTDCTCTVLPTAHCTPRQILCASSANCPSQWTCEQGGRSGTCSGGISPDGTPVPTVCTTTPGPSYCAPPYSSLVGGSRGSDSTVSSKGQATGAPTGTPGSGVAGGAGQPLNTAPSEGTGGSPGVVVGGNDQKSSARASGSNDSGGCRMGSGSGASSASALFGLLGFLGLARRRRARLTGGAEGLSCPFSHGGDRLRRGD
jgi:MYXO-CTERM domain-containing protein